MKFAEGNLIYLKPDVEAYLLRMARGGKWMQTGGLFKVKEVREKMQTLLVQDVTSKTPVVVRMDDAIPADVYERLPHIVAAKEAKAAAILVQQREDSEEAREERAYRERRDFMLEYGRPMTEEDKRQRTLAEFRKVAEAYGHTEVMTPPTRVGQTVTGRLSCKEPNVVDYVIPKERNVKWAGPPREDIFNQDDSTKHLQEALIKMIEKGYAVSTKDVEKVLMDIHQPISITVEGIKIGEINQFSGNPMELKDYDASPRRFSGGKNAPPELFDTFVTVKAKKEE